MRRQLATTRQRRIIAARANERCEYCRTPDGFSTDPFSVEHIYPAALGGTTTLDNLAYACQGCNGHKQTKTDGLHSLSGQTVPLYHPRQHRWRDHFVWDEDYLYLIGFTPTGRATIETLHLNRPGVVNIRFVLFLTGFHPPPEPEGE